MSAAASGYASTTCLAFVQLAVFIFALLLGLGTIKSPRQNLHIVLALAGFLLIIPILASIGANGSSRNSTYEWPSSGLACQIPKPESEYGTIISDRDEEFSANIYRLSKEQYRQYVEQCQKKGFTEVGTSDSDKYEAYNAEGYALDLDYYSSMEQMSIHLKIPIKMSIIDWSDIDAFKLLPKSKSNYGRAEWEYSEEALAYIGKTSYEDFQDYVKACKKAGFRSQLEKGEDYYYAYYGDTKKYLSLNFDGFNTMTIELSEDESEDDEEADTQTDRVKETETQTDRVKETETNTDKQKKKKKEKSSSSSSEKKTGQDEASDQSNNTKWTLEQTNAYQTAKNYLSFTPMSKAGLIDQLSSEYADNYPRDVAVFAVEQLEKRKEVNWVKQAEKCAKNYLEWSSFSKQGLIDQLSSDYGDKFTKNQAQRAVEKVFNS